MKERGFSLAELMVTMALLLLVSGIVGGVMQSMRAREVSTKAYAHDLSGLRRAARTLEADLRRADSLAAVNYKLEAGTLKRAGKPLLRRVAAFSLQSEGRLAHVELTLASRSDTATRKAQLTFDVRMRGSAQKVR